MFTKNWYYGLRSILTTNTSPNTTLYPNLKNLNGVLPSSVTSYMQSWVYITNNNTSSNIPSMYYIQTATDSGGGVILGTGTTTPTLDDYCLSGDMITTFTYSKNVTVISDESGVTITALYTITNTGSSAFTIGELGLIAATFSSTITSNKCLVERTVLDTPVTIPAGGVGQVEYTITFNLPTATTETN